MEFMGGATPKGLEEAGDGETPRLEMELPGVTAMPGAGDEPESQRGQLGSSKESFDVCQYIMFNIFSDN